MLKIQYSLVGYRFDRRASRHSSSFSVGHEQDGDAETFDRGDDNIGFCTACGAEVDVDDPASKCRFCGEVFDRAIHGRNHRGCLIVWEDYTELGIHLFHSDAMKALIDAHGSLSPWASECDSGEPDWRPRSAELLFSLVFNRPVIFRLVEIDANQWKINLKDLLGANFISE